ESKTPSQAQESRQPAPEPKDPLDLLERNLERVPLDQDAKLAVEMVFIQRPRLVRAKNDEAPSALKRALEEAGRPPAKAPMGVHREFTLRAGSAGERQAQIQRVLADLREAKSHAPADSDARLAMNLNYLPKSASGSQGAGSAGRSDAQNPPK